LVASPRHRFVPDDKDVSAILTLPFEPHAYRQVTDAYLISLCQSNRCKLATFDGGAKALAPEFVELIG